MANNVTKVTEKKAIETIHKNKGLLHAAAKELGITYRTLYNYVQRWPAAQEAVESSKELMKDFAQSKLYQAIANGEAWAICFFLKCMARDRGFSERLELQTTQGTKATIDPALQAKIIKELSPATRTELVDALNRIKGRKREMVKVIAEVTDVEEKE